MFVDTRAGYAAGSGEILGGCRLATAQVSEGNDSEAFEAAIWHGVYRWCCMLCDVFSSSTVPVTDQNPQDTHTQ